MALYMNEDLLDYLNIFNHGNPSFVLSIIRYLYPKIFMKNDTILRAGELADEFYIIKEG